MPVVIKGFVKDVKGHAVEAFEQEVKILKSLRGQSQHIPYFRGSTVDRDFIQLRKPKYHFVSNFMLVMHYIDNSRDLDSLPTLSPPWPQTHTNTSLNSTDSTWYDVWFALRLLKDIGEALQTMDKLNLRHGDIKPANILIADNKNDTKTIWNFYLIDFGMAFDYQPNQIDKYHIGGTFDYMAPEGLRIFNSDYDNQMLTHRRTQCVDSYSLVKQHSVFAWFVLTY